MGCICAISTDEYNGWECEITGCACSYHSPNQDVCAEQYGEVAHTEKWGKNRETKF